MSAFKVTNQTINTIVDFLAYEQYDRTAPTYGQCARLLHKKTNNVFVDKNTLDDDALISAMHQMNEDALQALYEDRLKEMYDNDRTFAPVGRKPLIEVFKRLSCYLYQCAEGTIPEKNPLYKALREIETYIAECIVEGMKEYKDIPWE